MKTSPWLDKICMCFICIPRKDIETKRNVLFSKLPKHYDFSKSMEKFQQFLNLILKYSMNFEKIMNDYQDFVKSGKDKLTEGNIEDDYKNFIDEHEEDLEKGLESNNFQTAVRGGKLWFFPYTTRS